MTADGSLVVEDIHKTFFIEKQRVDAIRGLSLSLKQGELVALIGHSGAGKSTLLHIIGTLDKPSSGKILISGQDLSFLNDFETSKFRNKSIGFVFQMNNLLPEFTALENIMMPALIAGMRKNLAQDRAVDMLRAVGLENRQRHRPSELSGGEQQRVAIARAIMMKPPLLLADEPTGNLDQKTGLAIEELLLGLCSSQNMSMILVTHDLALAERLPKQIMMEDGQIIDRGNH